jgi:XTP/dITP diphosphohydrolase
LSSPGARECGQFAFPRAPADTRRLVVASANAGKLGELRSLLSASPFELVGQGELGIAAVEETGTSYLENALLKARHAAQQSGEWAIADDSGLEVDALGGAPGIHSARYAGVRADDRANNFKLLAQLHGTPTAERSARYRCVVVLLAPERPHAPWIGEAVWQGRILEAPRGDGGFGYDPVFWLPEFGLTAAQLDRELKNRISHRGLAAHCLMQQLAARA